MNSFNPIAYWQQRYQSGGNSGAGSYGRLASFKVGFINAFTQENNVLELLDLGCGDGSIMQQLNVARYIGIDVSETALAQCRARRLNDPSRRFHLRSELAPERRVTMALSMDVIYHLTDEAGFADHMRILFTCAGAFVVIYASNTETPWNSPHVRHRRFTDYVQCNFPGWRLAAHCPNPYPYRPDAPNDTSFADFFIFTRPGTACRIPVPAS